MRRGCGRCTPWRSWRRPSSWRSAGRSGFTGLSQALSPDTLARLCGQSAKNPVTYAEARRLALPQAEVLVQGLRDSVASIASQSELAHNLIGRKISGPACLDEVVAEREAPLLMLGI